MTTVESRTRSSGYKIGWWVLVVINGLSILNHLAGPLAGFAETDDEVLAFFALAAMNIYALVVVVTAYRRGEPWAWWVTWIMIAIYGLTILYAPVVGPLYLGAAVVMAVAQLMTWSAFQQPDQSRNVV
ncbi:MAG: hypothetical protein ACLFWH_16000 [Actinomycetota bacterium]